jgi:hypothetical protein
VHFCSTDTAVVCLDARAVGDTKSMSKIRKWLPDVDWPRSGFPPPPSR